MKNRLPAIDWLRGIVVLIMVTDHASAAYNKGRLMVDSAFIYTPGQALPALFFYLAHIFLLEVSARILSLHEEAGLDASVIASVVVVLALYPACLWYRRYKSSHPRSWVRYI